MYCGYFQPFSTLLSWLILYSIQNVLLKWVRVRLRERQRGVEEGCLGEKQVLVTLRYSSRLWSVTGVSFPPFFSSRLAKPGRTKSKSRSSTGHPSTVKLEMDSWRWSGVYELKTQIRGVLNLVNFLVNRISHQSDVTLNLFLAVDHFL